MKIVFIMLLHIFLRSFGKQFCVYVCIYIYMYSGESFNLVGSMPKCFGSQVVESISHIHLYLKQKKVFYLEESTKS